MNIREIKQSDFQELIALYRQLNPGDTYENIKNTQKTFETILQSDWLTIFVIECEDEGENKDGDEGKIVATCYLNIIPNLTRQSKPYGVIENVVTHKNHRNKGLGKQLMLHTLKQAWEKGCYKVMLQTGSKKASTLSFYESCGFSQNDKTGFVVRAPSLEI